MLTPAEAIELARLMRERELIRGGAGETPMQCCARMRALFIGAFGEADFAAATDVAPQLKPGL